MKWTKELPTKTGWYWVKNSFEAINIPHTTICEIEQWANGDIYLCSGSDFDKLEEYDINGQWYSKTRMWAGPIELPTE